MEAFKSYGKHFVNVICMRSNICLHFVKNIRLNSKLVEKVSPSFLTALIGLFDHGTRLRQGDRCFVQFHALHQQYIEGCLS